MNASVRFACACLVTLLSSGLAACAWPWGAPAPVGGVVSESLVTRTATVEKVDLAARDVTLKSEDGSVFTIHCGEQVRNLAQVKVGDRVTASYYEAIAYEVHKPGTATVGAESSAGVARAKPGEKPAGMAAQELKVTATIVSIDRKTPSVTLKRPDGEVVAVRVRDPRRLEGVEVGDLVEITYTQALGIAVEEVPN